MNDPASNSKSPRTASDVSRLTEHLFRHESGKLVSVLTRFFGIERLALAEDVVQEALVRALQTWPYHGIPQNPAAWLTQTAKNLALDVIRRETRFREKQPEIIVSIEQWTPETDAAADGDTSEIKNDRLRLMFACCHPQLPPEDRTALALKTLCGFSPAEIARAFLTTEAGIVKRLTRARQKIRDLGIRFEIPEGESLRPRLESVLHTLYLLFNEGYKASTGDTLVREELCAEAIRLAGLLAEHPIGNQPRTHALLALMLFNAARLHTRTDEDGNILRLHEQDRSRWNVGMIAHGLRHLAESATGSDLTEYHLQAAIASCHCTAPDYASTDWPRILELYNQLAEIDRSPVVALNRAVALSHVEGPAAGLAALAAIRNRASFESYYLFHAVRGELESRLNHPAEAAAHFKTALELAEMKSERAFLARRLQECAEQVGTRRAQRAS